MRYESNYRNNSLQHGDRKEHKYIYKKWVNGSYRYYYDNDDKPDKGFSYKKMDKWQMENHMAINTPGMKGRNKVEKSYHLDVDGLKGGWRDVTQDVWENAGTGLYYKNEPVKNIVKRNVSDLKKTASKQIDKGQKFVTSALNGAKKGVREVTSKIKKRFK